MKQVIKEMQDLRRILNKNKDMDRELIIKKVNSFLTRWINLLDGRRYI